MRLSKQLFQERMSVPKNWREMETYKLFEATGLVEFPYSGIPLFLPLGKKMMDKVSTVIREEADARGFSEVYLPLVQNRRFLEETGRADLFGNEFFALGKGLDGIIMSPTNEEVFLDLGSRGLHSYRQLPVRVYQIAEKFRNIKKPKGILRSKQFLMCDMVSMDANEESLHESAALFEDVAQGVFSRLDIQPIRLEKNEGRYVDYVVPCPEGETAIVDDDGYRYAQNGEQGIRSSSVGMYFIFEQFGDAQPLYHSSDGGRKPVFLGTYGFGIQRCLHAVMQAHRDDLGINYPAQIRPFDASVLLLNPGDARQQELAEKATKALSRNGLQVLIDDRYDKTFKEKAEFSDFYGIPEKIIIGNREAETGAVTIKRRGANEASTMAYEALGGLHV